MFEWFDAPARLSVQLSQQAAEDLGADYIHTGHVLLGIRAGGDESLRNAATICSALLVMALLGDLAV